MNIPVLIEPVAVDMYRAKSGEPFAQSSEGATPEEALNKLKEAVNEQIAHGSQVVSLQVSSSEHPWMEFAGMFQEKDSTVQEWLQIMKTMRDEPEAIRDTET
jgi:hypothetical protein